MLLTGFSFAPGPVSPAPAAATLTVTTTVDELIRWDNFIVNTGCSLREAITNANDNASTYPECHTGGTYGDDVIILPAGTFVLDLGLGDLDILDSGDLEIQGAGAGTTIIDGNNTDRVFHICPIDSCDINVIFANVTIRNGRAGDGGGIHNNGSTTTLDASTIVSNTSEGHGGGIYNAGTLSVENSCTISNNTASAWGGGIYNADESTTTVRTSTVSYNRATSGGGIWNEGILSVQNDAFNHNTVGGWGGGISNANGGVATVNSSTFSANAAGWGGSILNKGTTTVSASVLSDGSAHDGGGIYNLSGTMTVDACIIKDNRTAGNGGGIFNEGSLTVENGSTIRSNVATDGGGIANNRNGTMIITDSRVLFNTATNGGGVYNEVNASNAISVTGSCLVGNSTFSFLNRQPAQQSATGNWWGAATGPDTPGADTTSGAIDTSGFLSSPILGCVLYRLYLPSILTSFSL